MSMFSGREIREALHSAIPEIRRIDIHPHTPAPGAVTVEVWPPEALPRAIALMRDLQPIGSTIVVTGGATDEPDP